MSERTIVIAEIGECFNGDIAAAKRLILAAKDAGCDVVKFQTLDYENISDDDPERDWFKKIALNPDKIDLLVKYAGETGIHILFTPENVKTAKWLSNAGLKSIKIASSTMADKELVQFIKDSFDTVFMSTGMASLDEVSEAVDVLSGVGDLCLMHCVSEYPTGPLLEQRGLKALAPCDVRLNMMKILMLKYPHLKVGYSDHTDGILAPVAAVAAGARVIEKHMTLDRKTPIEHFKLGKEYMGTDHVLSLEPPELKEMVRQIREVESMLGEWKWERTEGELILREFLRGRFGSS
ncbi:MAG: N-acetylneuraminate synthase family protein [Nitrospirae bacterium]|nr:N-acetylneuraminate synthase family protein [Nitrospirota bacterium]